MKTSTAMVKPILHALYGMRREMVPCFIGAPGIGKTQGLYEFADEIGVNVVTFILSNTVPSEISGIRMPDQESKKLEVFDDSRMASLNDGDILFFDEILEAPPALWSACLTLIQDRIMASGRKLPDVFIVAASNPVASPGIIPASTRDRFQFIELEFDEGHWRKWFISKYDRDPFKICPRIRSDSDQYNILTPRRVTKLFETLWNARDTDSYDVIMGIITNMFDNDVAAKLDMMVWAKPTAAQQISHALKSMKFESPAAISTMSMKEILKYLQEQPNWEEIQEVLSNIEFENYEEE